MRILILGGTAFLSLAMATEALARGHDVTCLARGSATRPPEGVRWVAADRRDGVDVYPREDFDAVVDVARDPRYVREALAALADRASHWTFVSTVSVYADDATPNQDETGPLVSAYEGDFLDDPEQYAGAKVACENACQEVVQDRLLINRPGLIAGTGDPSDRFGYWPSRFARAASGDDQVLVPDTDALTQVIGVHDLARWMVDAAEQRTTGIFNAVGDPLPLADVLDRVQRTVGHTGEQVKVDHEWLIDQGVAHWAGPESVPLWLPSDYTGFGCRRNDAARETGLTLTPLEDLVHEALAYERTLGLDRARSAGLTPSREAALLKAATS